MNKFFGTRIVFTSIITCSIVVFLVYFFLDKYAFLKAERTLVDVTIVRTAALKEFLISSEKEIKTVFEQPAVLNMIQMILEKRSVQKDSLLLSQQFIALLQAYKPMLNYKNCIVCDPRGKVLFSDTPVYANLSLEEKKFSNCQLGTSIRQVLMTLTTDIAEFSYDPFLKEPAFFITIPLFKNQKLQVIASIRLNEQKIYDITDNYIGLGVTGDLNIAKRISAGVLYLNPVRNEFLAPFKKFLPLSYSTVSKELTPMQQATLGYTGFGKLLDSSNVLSLASWNYVPRMNIGMVAKQAYQEIYKPFVLYKNILFGLLVGLFLLFLLFIFYNSALGSSSNSMIYRIRSAHEHQIYRMLWVVWMVSSMSVLVGLYSIYALEKKTIATKQNDISSQVNNAANEIEHILYKVELITQTLSYAISLGHLTPDELIARLKYHVSENAMITGISVAYAPYAYDTSKKLFGRYVTRTTAGIETFNIDKLYDYTLDSSTDSAYKVFYLDGVAEKGILWADPILEPLSKKFVAACSNDFYKEDKLAAVVTVFVDMDSISKIIESINMSAVGTSCLLSKDGVFIYHPSLNYKKDRTTIIEIAQRTGSPELISVWKKEKNDLQRFYSFKDVSTQQEKKAYFLPLSKTSWLLSIFFPQKIVEPPLTQLRHHYVIVLFLIVFFMISTLMLCLRISKVQNRTSVAQFFIISVPLLLCIFLLIAICYSFQTFQDDNKRVITTPLELEQFLVEKNEIASIVNEPAIVTIVTGIEITSLQSLEEGGVKVSGFIWQYYDDKEHKDIVPGVLFSQASAKAEFEKTYETRFGTKRVIGWNFFVEFPYEWNELLYPLDINEISIALEHPALDKNILLIPDLHAYQNMRPADLPGLNSHLNLIGFNIEKSSFCFKNDQPKTTYGIEAFGQSTAYFTLHFDIVAVRNIMNAILVFFLPIFIIMFAIYCFFSLSENHQLDLKETLTAYTGLLLTIIFLHRMLRDQRSADAVMYIEYFFLLTYVIIFILALHVFFQQTELGKKRWYKKLGYIYKVFFWDIQMMIGIIITTLIFY